MTILPSPVKAAPLVELSDLSAEMSLPPVGSGIMLPNGSVNTSASNDGQKSDNSPTAKRSRSTQCCAPRHESAPRHKNTPPLVRRGPDLSGLITLFKRSLLS